MGSDWGRKGRASIEDYATIKIPGFGSLLILLALWSLEDRSNNCLVSDPETSGDSGPFQQERVLLNSPQPPAKPFSRSASFAR